MTAREALPTPCDTQPEKSPNHNSIVSGKYINLNVLEMNVRVIILHKSILPADAHARGQERSTHFRVIK